MASSWDRRSAAAVGKLQDRLVREQVRHVVAPFSPYWKKRLADLGRTAASIDGVTALATVPAVGERDVSPGGDPATMAGLVVQASEGGFALHAPGPQVRRALRLRLSDRDAYRRLVDTDTKPTTYTWAGAGFRYPVASTRGDLDVVARAGARLWKVLGLTDADALLAAVPTASTTEHVALSYAALATGTPALFPGDRLNDVVATAQVAPPTVVAVPSARAAETLGALAATDGALDRLRTVLLIGAPTDEERAAAAAAVAGGVSVRAVHAPPAARVLWGECTGGAETGLHTYPDLDVVQLVAPETGEPSADGGELVLTQLGLRGTALFRWRTGDVVAGRVDGSRCPGCGRTVPRVRGVRRGALVLVSDDGRALDLRAVAGALAGRTDVVDWRILVGARRRDGRGQVLVHLVPRDDPGEVAVATATDIRTTAGLLPSQIIVASADELAGLDGARITERILSRR